MSKLTTTNVGISRRKILIGGACQGPFRFFNLFTTQQGR